MGIANSLFADVCGIPRPSLSQLLNGRNKKVSNEVIDKIHNAYPELSMMWLMFGDGEMLVPNANSDISDSQSQLPQDSFPGTASEGTARDAHVQHPINFDDEPTSFVPRKPAVSQRQSASISDAIAAATRGVTVPRRTGSVNDRRITSVVVVFNDGSTQVIVP